MIVKYYSTRWLKCYETRAHDTSSNLLTKGTEILAL
jgi:hypothetical protein